MIQRKLIDAVRDQYAGVAKGGLSNDSDSSHRHRYGCRLECVCDGQRRRMLRRNLVLLLHCSLKR